MVHPCYQQLQGWLPNYPLVMEEMRGIILFGFVSGVISYTIAEMDVFKGLREFLKKKNRFIGSLFSCFYCLGFYISAIICIVYLPNIVNQIPVIDEILTWFIIAGISGFVGLVFESLFRLSKGF